MISIKKYSIVQKPPSGLKPKVFVGMSGGVDSSVSAVLLKEAGYDVVGVFIKTWSPDWMECNWRDERRDAIRVAAQIDIPLLTLDLEKEYKQEVVDYMIAEYKIGRTPNPDVMCNRHIKFGAFFDWARSNGAEFIATGHYARKREVLIPADKNRPAYRTRYELLDGVDTNKDQTYFLWTLSNEQLAKIIFPIGELRKDQVREIAQDRGLYVAGKKDSQGVCFLGPLDMKDFLKHYIKTLPGDVLNEKGEVIGRHDGAMLYTIGEHFMGFVVAKDIEKNTITVTSNKPDATNGSTEYKLKDVSWISGEYPNPKKRYFARVRYRQELQKVLIRGLSVDSATVTFALPQVVDAGQSVVFYDDEVCLGGGVVS